MPLRIKVSAIIPTFNDPADKLLRSVQSVLNQSAEDWELIVVDDGSRTPFGGLDKTIPAGEQIRWLELGENRGVAAARNSAAEIARGRYLAFLDAGDWWEKDKLALQSALLETTSDRCCLVFCGARLFQAYCPPMEIFPEQHTDWVKALLLGQPIMGSASGVMVDKKTFSSIGGFCEAVDIPEDRDLWLRMALVGDIRFIDRVLTNVEISSGSRSSDIDGKRIAYKRFIQRHESLLLEYNLVNDANAYYHAVMANKYFFSDHLLKGLSESVRSLRYRVGWRTIRRMLIALTALVTTASYPGLRYRLEKFSAHARLRRNRYINE